MFAHLGITKSDVELLFNVLLAFANFYWLTKFNSIKVNDQILRTLQDQNEEQEKEIKLLEHKLLLHKIKNRKEEGTNNQPLA